MEQKAKRLKIVFLSCLDERTLADYSTFNELKLRPRDSEIFLLNEDWLNHCYANLLSNNYLEKTTLTYNDNEFKTKTKVFTICSLYL